MKYKNAAAALAAKDAAIATSRAIAAKAEAEGRLLTASERSIIDAQIVEARAAKTAHDELKGNESLVAYLNEIGGPVGASVGTGPDYRGSGLTVKGRLSPSAIAASVGAKAALENGSVVVPTPILGDLRREGQRPQLLSELFPLAPVGGDLFRYLRQTARTINASTVERGALKPTSVFTIESVDDRTRTIAHVSEPIARQDLDDSEAFRGFLAAEMRYGVLEVLDDLVVTGDGEGENFEGLLQLSGTGATLYDGDALVTARRAITNLELLHIVPSHWLIHPVDWETLELTRSDERFVLGDPATGGAALPIDRARKRLWGVDVVTSTAVPQGTAVLLDAADVVLVVREQVRVDVSENVSDDFSRNLVRIRAEMRGALAALRPAGIMAVELTPGSGS